MAAIARSALARALDYCGGLAVELAAFVIEYAPVDPQEALDYAAYVTADWEDMQDPVLYAGRNGDLQLLDWTRQRESASGGWGRATGERLSRGGSLGVLRWARTQGCRYGGEVGLGAATGGHLDALRWAYAIGLPCDSPSIQHEAAKGGFLDILQWHAGRFGLRTGGGKWAAAAERGHLLVLKWAFACGASIPWLDVCSRAAQNGHLEVLEWLADAEGPAVLTQAAVAERRGLAGAILDNAAAGGHLRVMRWARRQGLGWTKRSSSELAIRGDLPALQWALSDGCAWDPEASLMAALYGRLGVLQWAHASGFALDPGVLRYAAEAEGDRGTLLGWLLGVGCRWPCGAQAQEDGEHVCAQLAAEGDLSALRLIRAGGCPWGPDTTERAAWGGHFELLRWAHEGGCPWGAGTCAAAAGNGDLPMLQWIRERGCPWDEEVCEEASRSENPELIEWIHANDCPHAIEEDDEDDLAEAEGGVPFIERGGLRYCYCGR